MRDEEQLRAEEASLRAFQQADAPDFFGREALTERLIARLAEDHANARRLAANLAEIPGVTVVPAHVETNMVFFDVPGRDAAEFVTRLRAEGVLVLATGPQTCRAVTSYEVSAPDMERAAAVVQQVIGRS